MRNKNKRFYLLIVIAFILWLVPFLIRLFFINTDTSIETNRLQEKGIRNSQTVDNLVNSLNDNNKRKTFIIIFENNITGCIINVLGGTLLGLGTIVNLIINGFASSDVIVYSYNSGLSVREITHATLPHSFELIGFWISGAIGLSIAWKIILFMKNKEILDIQFYKDVLIQFIIVFIIILSAAYVEAYITILNI
ncbi:stage II sporulation protein M [Bacteroides fragilis]|uniref:Stage II sporulation protein M n=1 Tax=Bacteroides fragilis TaxID=817 RepID=A0AAP8ZTW1_BACFG|nr:MULTISPECIES: stage II sporulation protein M [Bacteroides]MBV4152516.1 stage II sporulation protein M [Bacteroides fragilis]MCE8578105.1 stage II sporulation protein M [Bacteroides fragilis]MCE8650759.1 stage II sporulation protein M [Bacteroides fragilis]MCM0348483.1 stage II sporulation protein M [Bacteroides fragilis]MCM0368694.1 stage II sporulation protein M [Bacteroides fragilis]